MLEFWNLHYFGYRPEDSFPSSLSPVVLDGAAHGEDPLPLLGVGRVVVAGQRLHQAQHAGDGPVGRGAGRFGIGRVEVRDN